ncbi:hypothetical protein PXH69_29280 [Rhodococcus qingshengii]|uniref:Tip attachment protein J domain-containing protein n=1 Tax=Rhodococcus qingshengii TaxID=334542 RepID=A0AAW6LVD0_RHOSG|nr:hypothetical protein [Rhodococcus qingshengii]MDE8649072.1 hypothetical protein [Rhodococcus qingshengii]
MAIGELQIEANRFCEFVKGEINSQPLPAPTLEFVGPEYANIFLERIECLSCSIDFAASVNRTVVVNAALNVHYLTSLAAVFAAGDLQPPATEVEPRTIQLLFSVDVVDGAAQLKWSAQASWAQAELPYTGELPMPLPDNAIATAGAVIASPALIAIRVGTATTDVLTTSPVDKLAGNDWTYLISGTFFVDLLKQNLSSALQKEVEPGELEISKVPRGEWEKSPAPCAHAWAEMTAIGRCVWLVDIPIDIDLVGTFEISGSALTITIVLSWDPDSTWCEILGSAILSPFTGSVINTILEPFQTNSVAAFVPIRMYADSEVSSRMEDVDPPGPGFQKVETGATDSVTYRRTTQLGVFGNQFLFKSAAVTSAGLEMRGSLKPRPGLKGLVGEFSVPGFGYQMACEPSPTAGVKWFPGTVSLRGVNHIGPPHVFTESTALTPPNAWAVVYDKSAYFANELVVTFNDPPGQRLPIGTETSVVLFTDCGIRGVNFGPIPADTLSGDTAVLRNWKRAANQICGAITDPWTEQIDGRVILEWMVNPLLDPDPDRIKLMAPLRLWTLGLRDLPAGIPIEFVAVNGQGLERSIGILDGLSVAAMNVVTRADEKLGIRTREQIAAPGVAVMRQTWLSPMDSTPLDGFGVESYHPRSSTFELRRNNSEVRYVRVGQSTFDEPPIMPARDVTATHPSIERVDASANGGPPAWARVHRLDRRTIAFGDGDRLIVATMKPTTRIR